MKIEGDISAGFPNEADKWFAALGALDSMLHQPTVTLELSELWALMHADRRRERAKSQFRATGGE